VWRQGELPVQDFKICRMERLVLFKMDELPNQGQPEEVKEVEQDSGEKEEIDDLMSLIAPDVSIQKTCRHFGMGYNRSVFDGWVKQYSACCGAASVAGCINALANIHRREPNSLNHKDVLLVYESLFMDAIDRKVGSFERRLGCFPNTLLGFITSTLSKELNFFFGRQIGGKKGVGATKMIVFKALCQLCKKHLLCFTSSSMTSDTLSSPRAEAKIMEEKGFENQKCTASSFGRSVIDCFVELLGDEVGSEAKVEGEEDERNNENSDDEEDCDDEEAVSKGGGGGGGGGAGGGKHAWGTWRNELMDIVKNLSGLAKLRASKPSTAPIGNWAVLQGVQRLSEWTSFGTLLSCRLFMGKRSNPKQKLDVSLSRRDSDEVIKSQWDTLKAQFSSPETILLFHLKNHYAIIFAWREWTIDELTISKEGSTPSPKIEQKMVRQILTARKGQRPTAWIDFAEARETMLNWVGYKMMAVSCSSADKEALKKLTFEVPEHFLTKRFEMLSQLGSD